MPADPASASLTPRCLTGQGPRTPRCALVVSSLVEKMAQLGGFLLLHSADDLHLTLLFPVELQLYRNVR